MGRGKLFLSLMRISLFSIGVVCSSGYSMEQQVVTFKSLEGFPCSSIVRSNRLWNEFSPQKKDDLRKKIGGARDESLLFFFKIATQLAPETQKTIALYVMNGNPIQAGNFLNNSINDMAPRCILAHNVFDKKALKNFQLLAFDPNKPDEWKIGVIFGLLDEIVLLDEIMINGPVDRSFTKQELKAILRVSSRFGRVKEENVWVSYRDVYTASNFLKTISKKQLNYGVLCATPLAGALLGKVLGVKALDQKILDADESWERAVWRDLKIKDPFPYAQEDMGKIMAPYFWIPLGSSMFDGICLSNDFQYISWSRACIRGIGCAFKAFAIATLLSWLNDILLPSVSPVCENKLIAGGSILATYIVGCSLYNISKMRSLKRCCVPVTRLAQWFERKDVVLE